MRWPQQPSASTVALAVMSVPGSKLPSGSPSLPRPLSPERTPRDDAVLDEQLRRRGLGQDVGAGLLGLRCWKRASAETETTSLPWFLNGGGVGMRTLQLAGRQQVDGLLGDLAEGEALLAPVLARDVGEQLLQRPGRMTAPDRLWPPQVLAFSMTATGHLAEALHDGSGSSAEQLQQAVGAGEAGGAAADDRDADLDPLVLGVELALDELLAASRPAAGSPPGRRLPFAVAVPAMASAALLGLHGLGELRAGSC